MRSGSAARVAPHFNHGRQNRNKDMNRNTDSRTRIECTDWDEEVPVATWAKGCGRSGGRTSSRAGPRDVRDKRDERDKKPCDSATSATLR